MAGADPGAIRTVRLLRHAKSSWDQPDLADHERPLTERGVRAAGLIGRYLGERGASVDLVLCSTAVRARQTFDHVLGSIGRPEVRFESDIYGADAASLIGMLRELTDPIRSVLVVGHNPAMHELAVLLVGDGNAAARESLRERFPTGALATISAPPGSWRDLREHSGRLESFVIPRRLAV